MSLKMQYCLQMSSLESKHVKKVIIFYYLGKCLNLEDQIMGVILQSHQFPIKVLNTCGGMSGHHYVVNSTNFSKLGRPR